MNKIIGKIPLKLIFIIPFVLQICGTVGIVGYLSFRNGQQVTEDLANTLINEVTNRINDKLDNYLKTPHLINEINVNAVQLEQLELDNYKSLESHFWQQIQLFDDATYIYFGSSQELFIGTGISSGNQVEVGYSDSQTRTFSTYGTNKLGKRTKLMSAIPDYYLFTRPWYLAGKQNQRASWGEIYLWAAPYPNLALPAVYFEIADTGFGMSSEEIKLIFLPFERLNHHKYQQSEGAGLGLAITQKIIEMMDSKIKVESEIGIGSKFYFELPLLIQNIQFPLIKESTNKKKQKYKLDSNFSHKYPLNILLAEDHIVNQKVITKIFDRLGYKIAIVNDGLKAVQILKKQKFDVIFMDVQMPKMNGLDATIEIRKTHQKNDLLIVAMTANVMEEDKKACFTAGMDYFIAKPIKIETLLEILTKIVNTINPRSKS